MKVTRSPTQHSQIRQQFQFYISYRNIISFPPTGRTHISSTRPWRASSSYRLCCGPSSPAALAYQTVAVPQRWPHQTPPSDSFVSVPSTQRTSQPRFFPPAPWHLPPAPASPSFLPTRLALWRPPAGRTASLRGWWAWGGSGGGFRGPTSPRRFERKRGWPRWSRATGRLSDCSRSGGVCRTRPDGEEQREKFYFIYIYFNICLVQSLYFDLSHLPSLWPHTDALEHTQVL